MWRYLFPGMLHLLWMTLVCASANADMTPERLDTVYYLEDSSAQLDSKGARAAFSEGRFTPAPRDQILNFGYSRSVIWLYLPLDALPVLEHGKYVLELPYFSLNKIDIYLPGRSPIELGLDRPASPHALDYRFPAVAIPTKSLARGAGDIGAEKQGGVLIHVESQGSLTLPLRLWLEEAFAEHARDSTFVLALYYGALLALALYNLLVYMALRDRSYLLYSGFVLSLGAGMFAYNGLSMVYLRQWTPLHETSALFAIAGVFGALFARRVLHSRAHAPRIDVALRVTLLLLLLIALIGLVWPLQRSVAILFSVGVAAGALLVLLAAMASFRARHAGSGYFLIAWSLLLASVVVSALRNLDVVPTNGLTLNLLQLSSTAEMLLLSLALGARIEGERTAKARAQVEAEHLREQLVETLRGKERDLSTRIEEQTLALREALGREHATVKQFRQFASLIAHEFRNPLGVIRAQAQLGLRELEVERSVPPERFNAVEHAAARLQALFEHWLQSEQIVSGELIIHREPLRLDRWLPSLIDPEQSACTLEPVPALHIEADPALLRMALDNLLDNARKYAGPGARITVRTVLAETAPAAADTAAPDTAAHPDTREAGETGSAGPATHSSGAATPEVAMLGIEVADDGPGIAREDQARIFESYQRGRERGNASGLGLGLFLVRRIMALHGGRVSLHSTPGAGSRFTLWLPLPADAGAPSV